MLLGDILGHLFARRRPLLTGERFLTVTWLFFILGIGILTGLRGYGSKDSMTHYIVILGAVMAGLLFAVAVKHLDGFLEVQIGIIASLIVALASTKERNPRRRDRRPAKTKGSPRPSSPIPVKKGRQGV